MIQFSVSVSDGQYSGFTCKGHAGYADAGYDIICSAVSVLTVNTINSIEALTEDAFIAEQGEDGGYLKFRWKEKPSKKGILLLESLIIGMQSIQESYGKKYISLSIPKMHDR